MFLCRHCPYVAHVRAGVAGLARDRDPRLAIVAISANDPEAYPEDAPVGLAAEAVEAGYTFPYLFDETQEVAKGYTAACTPDFFLFDRDRRLAYRGQFDDSRPRNDVPVTGKDLRAAIDAVLSESDPPPTSARAWAAASSGARATNPPSAEPDLGPGVSAPRRWVPERGTLWRRHRERRARTRRDGRGAARGSRARRGGAGIGTPPAATERPDDEKAEDELEPLEGGAETIADLDEEGGQANRPGTERPPV